MVVPPPTMHSHTLPPVLLFLPNLAAVPIDIIMHGTWEPHEDLFISTLRLGTNYSWGRIEEEFNKRFRQATKKDLESRYNKNLRPTIDSEDGPSKRQASDIIDDYRHYQDVRDLSKEEVEIIQKALLILQDYPADRLW
jgi:hypothetical protein